MRHFLIIFLTLCLLVGVPVDIVAENPDEKNPVIVEPGPEAPPSLPKIKKAGIPSGAKAAVAIDTETGEIYASKNAKKSLPVASVSKLMTIWLVFQKIENGESIKQKVKIKSRKITKLSKSSMCGGFVLNYGKTYTVEDLIKLTMIESSNAASIQLGIWVSGSNKAFIKKMNREAKKLGLKKSSFTSACGLDNYDLKNYGLTVRGGKDGTNRMSALDIAILSGMLIEKYPKVLKYSKSTDKKVKGKHLRNTNRVLTKKSIKKKAKTLRVDGLKTGYTDWAGLCLASTCNPKGKKRIVTVILNDSNVYSDSVSLMKKVYSKNPKRLLKEPSS